MSREWRRPTITNVDQIITWQTQELPRPPSTFGEFLDSEGPRYEQVAATSEESYRVPTDKLPPYKWICRIYFRTLTWRSAEVGVPLNRGVRLASSWNQATAWLVKCAHEPQGAHEPGEKSQWLLTCAHNFVGDVPQHDNTGKVTDLGKMEPALADAIYVVAGWGQQHFAGWVDRVAAMEGYYRDAQNHAHLDGAAIHIKNSTIPADFYQSAAPQIAELRTTLTAPFIVVGYPGALNRYRDLQGLYIAGDRRPAAAGVVITDFKAVTVTRGPWESHPGDILTFDQGDVTTSQGVSGSPSIILVQSRSNIVASLHTDGIAAPLVKRIGTEDVRGVDPLGLILAIGGSGMEWVNWVVDGHTWAVLQRETKE